MNKRQRKKRFKRLGMSISGLSRAHYALWKSMDYCSTPFHEMPIARIQETMDKIRDNIMNSIQYMSVPKFTIESMKRPESLYYSRLSNPEEFPK